MSCKNCKYNHQTAAQCMRVGMCRANVELLESKLAKAVKALKKHGQHLTRPMCKKGGPIRCSCGFDEALSKIQSNIESP